RRRPDEGPREFARAKRLLGRELRAVELHRMAGAGAVDGDEDEVLDARGHGGRNQVLVALHVNWPRSAPAGTEAGDRRNHGPDADQRGLQRRRDAHVARHQLNVRRLERTRSRRIAAEDTNTTATSG